MPKDTKDLLNEIFKAAERGEKNKVLSILNEENLFKVDVYKPGNAWTLLHYAAAKDWKDVAEKLLIKDADIFAGENWRDLFKHQRTPLELAIDNRSWSVVAFLVTKLQKKAILNQTLFYLVNSMPDDKNKDDAEEALSILLNKGASANYSPSDSTDTVLHIATQRNLLSTVKALVNKEANVLRCGVGAAKAAMGHAAAVRTRGTFKETGDSIRRTSPIVLAANLGYWDLFDIMFNSLDFESVELPLDSHQQGILHEALKKLVASSDDVRIEKLLQLGAPIRPVGLTSKINIDKESLGSWIHQRNNIITQSRLAGLTNSEDVSVKESGLVSFDIGVTPGLNKKSRSRVSASNEESFKGITVQEAENFLLTLARSGAGLIVGASEFIILIRLVCKHNSGKLLGILKSDFATRNFIEEDRSGVSKKGVEEILVSVNNVFEPLNRLKNISQCYQGEKGCNKEMVGDLLEAKSIVLLTLFEKLRNIQKTISCAKNDNREKEEVRCFLAMLKWGSVQDEQEVILTGRSSLGTRASNGKTSRMGLVISVLCKMFGVTDQYVSEISNNKRVYSILHRDKLDLFLQNHVDVIYNDKSSPASVIQRAVKEPEKESKLRSLITALGEKLPVLAQLRVLFDHDNTYRPVQDVRFLKMLPSYYIHNYINHAVGHGSFDLLVDLEAAVSTKKQSDLSLESVYEWAKVTVQLKNLQKKYQDKPAAGNSIKREVSNKLVDLLTAGKYSDVEEFVGNLYGTNGSNDKWRAATKGDPSVLGQCLNTLRENDCFTDLPAPESRATTSAAARAT